MKKYLLLVLCGLSLFGCNKTNQSQELIFREQPVSISQIPKKVSYKLEDLCDTEIKERDLTLHVYIEDSNILWDYHEYKNELFGYVKDFFGENQIKCNFVYSNSPFQKFNSNNEFGLEIWDSEKDVENRYYQLITEQDGIPKENPLYLAGKGYAVTRAGIALINGGWEEFRDQMKSGELTIEEIEKQFPETYKGTTVKEYHLKDDIAANICHELGHCMGLFHPEEKIRVEKYTNNIPNIMSYENPKFGRNVIGFTLNPLQKKLIHSFIAGNNTYKAWLDSQRDLEFYLDNIKEENNSEYSKP